MSHSDMYRTAPRDSCCMFFQVLPSPPRSKRQGFSMGNSTKLMEASMRQPSASISRPRQHRPGQLAAKKGVLPTHFHPQTLQCYNFTAKNRRQMKMWLDWLSSTGSICDSRLETRHLLESFQASIVQVVPNLHFLRKNCEESVNQWQTPNTFRHPILSDISSDQNRWDWDWKKKSSTLPSKFIQNPPKEAKQTVEILIFFKDIDLQDTGPAFHPGCIESVAPGPRELRRALVCLRVAGCCVNVFVDDEDKDVKEQ